MSCCVECRGALSEQPPACKTARPPSPLPAPSPATAARQTFNRPAQLILVVLPDTGG